MLKLSISLLFLLPSVCTLQLPQDQIERFNHAIESLDCPFDGMSVESDLIHRITKDVNGYYQTGGHHPLRREEVMASIYATRLHKVIMSPLLTSEIAHLQFIDSLIQEMITVSIPEQMKTTALQATTLYRLAAEQCVEEMMREGESQNIFEPSTATKMAYLFYRRSDEHIVFYEQTFKEACPVQISEWTPSDTSIRK